MNLYSIFKTRTSKFIWSLVKIFIDKQQTVVTLRKQYVLNLVNLTDSESLSDTDYMPQNKIRLAQNVIHEVKYPESDIRRIRVSGTGSDPAGFVTNYPEPDPVEKNPSGTPLFETNCFLEFRNVQETK